jgi:hypothetical protein
MITPFKPRNSVLIVFGFLVLGLILIVTNSNLPFGILLMLFIGCPSWVPLLRTTGLVWIKREGIIYITSSEAPACPDSSRLFALKT